MSGTEIKLLENYARKLLNEKSHPDSGNYVELQHIFTRLEELRRKENDSGDTWY